MNTCMITSQYFAGGGKDMKVRASASCKSAAQGGLPATVESWMARGAYWESFPLKKVFGRRPFRTFWLFQNQSGPFTRKTLYVGVSRNGRVRICPRLSLVESSTPLKKCLKCLEDSGTQIQHRFMFSCIRE